MPVDELSVVRVKSRAAWREWLQKNHLQQKGVWVLLYKKDSSKFNLSSDAVVEECLCFGWIDSVPRKVDAESWKLLVTPRRKKSGWSRVNKERVEKLLRAKKIAPLGLERIEQAKADGSWTALERSDRLEVPVQLTKALQKNRKAKLGFESFAPSLKRGLLERFYAAKSEETQTKRILEILKLAEERAEKKRLG